MAIAISHGTSADGTFSSAGATAWNAAHSVSGLSSTSGALLYSTDATTLAQDGTNLLYTTASGPRLQVGSGSGTNQGAIIGYYGVSGASAIWGTNVTPGATNYSIAFLNNQTVFNSPSQLSLATAGTAKLDLFNTAGRGPEITAGTATTDVAALSVTRTNNNAAVATGVKFAFTDTTSAAGFLPFQVLGGASASTNLFSVDKGGYWATSAAASNSVPIIGFSTASGRGIGLGSNSDLIFFGNGGPSISVGSSISIAANNSTTGVAWRGTDAYGNGTVASISKAASNSLIFGPGDGGAGCASAGAATTRTEINKSVTAFTDGAAKTVFTLTIPNAAHSASYLVRVTGSIGAGGAIGANEASATNCYVVTLTRTAGVNATAAISSAFGAAATNVAGATTVTCTAALAAVSGGVGASNTIDIQATITKGGGSSDNHTCVATASLLNANSTGVTIS